MSEQITREPVARSRDSLTCFTCATFPVEKIDDKPRIERICAIHLGVSASRLSLEEILRETNRSLEKLNG